MAKKKNVKVQPNTDQNDKVESKYRVTTSGGVYLFHPAYASRIINIERNKKLGEHQKEALIETLARALGVEPVLDYRPGGHLDFSVTPDSSCIPGGEKRPSLRAQKESGYVGKAMRSRIVRHY